VAGGAAGPLVVMRGTRERAQGGGRCWGGGSGPRFAESVPTRDARQRRAAPRRAFNGSDTLHFCPRPVRARARPPRSHVALCACLFTDLSLFPLFGQLSVLASLLQQAGPPYTGVLCVWTYQAPRRVVRGAPAAEVVGQQRKAGRPWVDGRIVDAVRKLGYPLSDFTRVTFAVQWQAWHLDPTCARRRRQLGGGSPPSWRTVPRVRRCPFYIRFQRSSAWWALARGPAAGSPR
jgi:hypothetical protein